MATKTKTKKKTVRGPQYLLSISPARTPRLRYIEPLTEAERRKDGNPFFALRVPGAMLRAFKAKAKARKTTATAMVREYMSKVTGIELEADGAE